MPSTWLDRFVVSPCSNPELTLDDALQAYSAIGYRKFEMFSSWVKSAADSTQEPQSYLDTAARYNMTYKSFHLPPVLDDLNESLEAAVNAARFAQSLGATLLIFKASSRENYIRSGRKFLDRIADLDVTPVLQNHFGQSIATLEDFSEVIEGINDERMKTLLEVGHFHSAGVHWRDGYALLGDSIALVHIKDQIGQESVAFGRGEIDLPGLFTQLESVGYDGDYVIEMENTDRENTISYLADALDYVQQHAPELNS